MKTKHRIASVLAAKAALVSALVLAHTGSAYADDYGCQVLLCLSNPAGPMAVAECVPPIRRLFEEMARLHPPPFPTCGLAGGSGTAAFQGGASGNYCPEAIASYSCNNQRTCGAQGSIGVNINGVPQRRYWWSSQGFAFTEAPPNNGLLTPQPPNPPIVCDDNHGDGGGTE